MSVADPTSERRKRGERLTARWQRSADFSSVGSSPAGSHPGATVWSAVCTWGARLGLFALGAVAHYAASGAREDVSDAAVGGCPSPTECRRQVERARRAASRCWLWCTEEQEQLKAAVRQLQIVEERDAMQAYYAEREARERAERRRAEQEQERTAEREIRLRRQAAEHARLDLLRIRSQAQQQEQERSRERYRAYLSLLSVDERLQRLERCHASGDDCAGEVGRLLEAAGDAEERRELVRRNEEILNARSDDSPVQSASVYEP